MLNDLAVFAERWRWKKPYGDTEGDAHKGWPADPKAYYLYFPDDGTYGREALGDLDGFWVRGGRSAEVFLRALEPVTTARVRLVGGPAGDTTDVAFGAGGQRLAVGPGATAEATLAPGAPFVYKDSFVYVLRFRSRTGAPDPAHAGDTRVLGTFVRIDLQVAKRPRATGR
jgi:hypothetical protein